VVAFDFRRQLAFVKFIGTHAEYDRVDVLTASQFWRETRMDIRPIRTDEDHRAALEEIEACWGAAEGTEVGDKLEVLAALVELYEAKRWPVDTAESFDPIDVLRYAMEELGHTQAELGELLGSRSRASEILSRRRPLTVEMIHKISEAWKIPAELLVRPYSIGRVA
jgi:HTH-type transcriptional regulator / antitoxin HigA